MPLPPAPSREGCVVRSLAELDPARLRAVRDRCHAAISAARDLPPVEDGHLVLARARWGARHRRVALELVRSVALLPRVTIALGDGPGGRAIATQLQAHCGGPQWWRTLARSVYAVPPDGRPYKGRSNHSRRSAVNQSRAAGVEVRLVGPQELESNESVRRFGYCLIPDCGGRTFAAFAPTGLALGVTHVHVDGTLAELAQAMNADADPLTSTARFALFACVVEDLAASGVELIVVLSSWLWVTYGVRVFQNVLGFQPCQLIISS